MYFAGKSFDKNGDEEVEQDVVAERHQKYEIESGPRRRHRHAGVQYLVPVFLRQNLSTSTRTSTVHVQVALLSQRGRAMLRVCQ